ncbi:MAG TPA: alpha/beta fold hydrolase, partial [Solirubrobacteraceae bacterium]
TPKIIACLAMAVAAQAASAAEPGDVRGPHDTATLRLAQAAPARATAAALRKVITDLQRGAPDAASMEPALYAALQSQGGAGLLARFGALQGLEFVASQNGADVYRVTFQNGVTLWTIALSPSGRIAGLFFKPVEAPETAGEDVTVGILSGTLLKPPGVERPPVVLLVAGSGPTDRNGNQGGAGPGELRQLAEALAQRGVASLRYDKRGIGRSAVAGLREQDMVLGSFVDDAAAWITWLQQRRDLGAPIVAGHSEGGLIAILLAKRIPVSGIVLIATPGRRLGDVLREQLQQNGMPAPLLSDAIATIAALERGESVSTVKPELAALFRPSVQPFMRSTLAVDPAGELGGLKLPVMIVAGGHDLQVSAADAALLAQARPDAVRLDIPDMNHVLKIAPADRAGQQNAYANPSLPLAPGLGDAVAAFAKRVAQ